MSLDAVGHAGFGVGFRQVGEGKDVGRVEGVEERMSVAGGLREAVIETTEAAAGHVGHHAVEGCLAALIVVESVLEELAQEASALRDAEADDALHRVGW